jgi:hypothetical protein
MRLRSAVAILVLSGSPLAAQGRTIDQGTFTISKSGAPASTESFRILRREDGQITATSHQVTGTRQTRSTLTADSSGMPTRYDLSVKDRNATMLTIVGQGRPGRFVSSSTTPPGDESVREYPMPPKTVLLDEGMLHQLYFVPLGKRSGSFQLLDPRSPRPISATLTPKGLEPVDVGGKSITATHYSLAAGSARYEFWVDAEGRLLRIELPAQGLVATREDAPR